MKGLISIYFDFNDPIITNEVKTIIKDKTVHSEEELKVISLQILPNPAFDYISFDLKNINYSDISLYDINGIKMPLQIESQFVDIRHLHSGTYSLVIRAGGKLYVGRFVKI